MPENQSFPTQPYVDYFNDIGNAFSSVGALGQQSLQPQIRNNARLVSAIGDGFTGLAAAIDAGDESSFQAAARDIAEAAGSIAAGAAATSILSFGANLALAALADVAVGGLLALPFMYPLISLIAVGVILYFVLDDVSEFGEWVGGKLFDLGSELSSWLSRTFGSVFFDIDPLLLDLDLGGVSLTSLSASNAYFDLNNNGFAERTGWVAAGEGLLALDGNRNGRIDNGSELFGSATQNGFAALARYDENGDGRITADDSVWSSLLIWRDANGDGISTAAELTPIAANDIGSIGLSYRTPRSYGSFVPTRTGNSLLGIGSYTSTNGVNAEAIAVGFSSDQSNTRFILPDGFEYDPEVFGLPNLSVAANDCEDIDEKIIAACD